MVLQNPYQSYRQNSVTMATPEELVVMMYKALERFIRQSAVYIEQGDVEGANNALLKAEDIIDALRASLNMDIGISGQLTGLYDFLKDSLINANVKKDAGLLTEVLEMVTGLREAWEQASIRIRQLKYCE
jgi:flagellar protein FliS